MSSIHPPEVVVIAIEEIARCETQPRTVFEIEELVANMQANGYDPTWPLIVRPRLGDYSIEQDEETKLFSIIYLSPDGTMKSVETHKKKSEAESRLSIIGRRFELIDGERRWRAAHVAGIAEVPCILRALDDRAVAETQLIGFLQREQLNPIEEAHAIDRMLAMKDDSGAVVWTTEALGQRLGKKPYSLLRLRKLVRVEGKARAAVEDETLPYRTALLIARQPTPALREKAAKGILFPTDKMGPLSYRAAQIYLSTEIAKSLRNTQFDQDDAELVPVEFDDQGDRCAGGACSDCPLKEALGRDGAPSPIAGTASGTTMCLNPHCFAAKEEEAWARWQAENTNPEKNRRALSRKECEDIFPLAENPDMLRSWGHDYARLSDKPGMDVIRGEAQKGEIPTWKKVLKGIEMEVVVARNRAGKTVELVNEKLAIEAVLNRYRERDALKQELEAAKANNVPANDPLLAETAARAKELEKVLGDEQPIFRTADADDRQSHEDRQAQREKEQRERVKQERIDEAALTAVIAKVSTSKKLPDEVMEILIETLMEAVDEQGDLYEIALRRGMPEDEADSCDESCSAFLKTELGKMPEHQRMGLLVELALGTCYELARREKTVELAKALSVDLKAVKKQVLEEIKAEEKAAADAAATEGKLGEGMTWAAPVKDRAEFEWNEHSVCTNPDELVLSFPKASKIALTLSVATAPAFSGWFSNLDVQIGTTSHSGPVKPDSVPEVSRLEALVGVACEAREWLRKNGAKEAALETLNGYLDALRALAKAEQTPLPKAGKKGKK